MKKRSRYLQAWLFILLMMTGQNSLQARDKLAQSGFQFLSVISDGQASALAGALTARDFRSSSLFFNPAGMARMSTFLDMTASINEWIGDIRHNTFSLALNPARGKYGVWGVSVQTVNYGQVYGTVVAKNEAGFLDTEIIEPTAKAIGIGYAKAITDRFSVGGQVRYVEQDLGNSTIPTVMTLTDTTTGKTDNALQPLAFDFGTIYKTDLKGLSFGMSVRNFSKEIKYAKEGFELPLVFTMGIAMDLMNLLPATGLDQSAILSVDASHYRSHPEQIKVGLDYTLLRTLALRVGYASSSYEESVSYGFGVTKLGLSLDYTYTPFGLFDNVKRYTVRFSL
jgi:hypothetical protein